jgi:hypothetical protein
VLPGGNTDKMRTQRQSSSRSGGLSSPKLLALNARVYVCPPAEVHHDRL